MIVTLIQLHFEVNGWRKNNDLRQWLFNHILILYVISAVCGSSFTGVQICSSNFLNIKQLDIPLSSRQITTFYNKRIYSVVFLEV